MENIYTPIVTQIDRQCALFARDAEVGYRFVPYRESEEDPYEDCAAELSFDGFSAALLFSSGLRTVPNVLECRITFAQGDDRIDYSLYDLLYLLDENDFKCYIFYAIDSPEFASYCLSVILDAISRYREQLCAIGRNKELCEKAQERKNREIKALIRADVLGSGMRSGEPLLEWQLRNYRDIYVGRLCAPWYTEYVHGNYEKAAKKLSKYASKSAYEQRLLKFITTLVSGASYEAVPAECDNFGGRMSSGSKPVSLLSGLLTFAVSLPVAGAAFSALYCAGRAIIYRGVTVTPIPTAQFIATVVFCSVFAAALFARVFFGIFLPKKEKKAAEVIGGVTARKRDMAVGRRILRICLLLLIFFTVFQAKSAYTLDSGYLTDNTGFSRTQYPRDEIVALDAGNRTLIMNDGRVIYLRPGYDFTKLAKELEK